MITSLFGYCQLHCFPLVFFSYNDSYLIQHSINYFFSTSPHFKIFIIQSALYVNQLTDCSGPTLVVVLVSSFYICSFGKIVGLNGRWCINLSLTIMQKGKLGQNEWLKIKNFLRLYRMAGRRQIYCISAPHNNPISLLWGLHVGDEVEK